MSSLNNNSEGLRLQGLTSWEQVWGGQATVWARELVAGIRPGVPRSYQGLLPSHVPFPTSILLGGKEHWPLPEGVPSGQIRMVTFMCSTSTGHQCDLKKVPSLSWALASWAITWSPCHLPPRPAA